MFESIIVKRERTTNESHLNIADLIDRMLYYNQVHILMSQFELKDLLDAFGEDLLLELIKSKRIIIHPCDQHFGVAKQPIGDNLYSMGIFTRNMDIHRLLFTFHKSIIDDEQANHRFADRFAKVLSEYHYPMIANDTAYKDMEDPDIFARLGKAYLSQNYPTYDCDNLQIEAVPSTRFNGFYTIDSNIDINKLNDIIKKQGYNYGFDFSGLLLSLGETSLDCLVAADLKSELLGDSRYAKVYEARYDDAIEKAKKSNKNLQSFKDNHSFDFLSVGQGYLQNRLKEKDLLNLLMSENSVNFRVWLSTLPDSDYKNLDNEFNSECENRLSNTTFSKFTRAFILTTIALIPDIGFELAIGASIFDIFIGQMMIDGWKPNIFVNNVLRKKELAKTRLYKS